MHYLLVSCLRYLQASLRSLQSCFPQVIGDIRGIGLFVGLDIVACPIAKTPGPMFAAAIKEAAKARRVLLSTDGPADNVIKIKPPLVFGPAEVDRLTAVLA
jgi:4-aminobutyrate aminotransferase-like enzyme